MTVVKMVEETIEIPEGDEPLLEIIFNTPDPNDATGETKVPLDLTGKTIEIIVKTNRDVDDDDPIKKYSSDVPGEIDVLDQNDAETKGHAQLQVTSVVTATKGNYFYKIRVISGGHPVTPKGGVWTVKNT